MKFWPERLTVRHVCGVLVVLVIAECLYAYSNTLPRQMGRFEKRRLVLTVEEVPAMSFPAQFFGPAHAFYYRFTLISARDGWVYSSFLVYRGSSDPRYKSVEELKLLPGVNVDEGLLFGCAFDGRDEVSCSGAPLHGIHWRAGGSVMRDFLKAKVAAQEPATFPDDPEWQGEERRAAEKRRQ